MDGEAYARYKAQLVCQRRAESQRIRTFVQIDGTHFNGPLYRGDDPHEGIDARWYRIDSCSNNVISRQHNSRVEELVKNAIKTLSELSRLSKEHANELLAAAGLLTGWLLTMSDERATETRTCVICGRATKWSKDNQQYYKLITLVLQCRACSVSLSSRHVERQPLQCTTKFSYFTLLIHWIFQFLHENKYPHCRSYMDAFCIVYTEGI